MIGYFVVGGAGAIATLVFVVLWRTAQKKIAGLKGELNVKQVLLDTSQRSLGTVQESLKEAEKEKSANLKTGQAQARVLEAQLVDCRRRLEKAENAKQAADDLNDAFGGGKKESSS